MSKNISELLDIVRDALGRFVKRAEGCADPACLVCADNKRIASEAFDAIDQLRKEARHGGN